jgi:hypothetical protein
VDRLGPLAEACRHGVESEERAGGGHEFWYRLC